MKSFMLLLLIPLAVAGCGVPAIRTAAHVSHSIHVGMETTGDLIVEQTQRSIDRCGSDPVCVENVSGDAERMASIHDAAAPVVDAYRDEVLLACGVDPSDPRAVAPDTCPQPPDDTWARIQRLGLDALAAIPDVIAALRAFGIEPPAELLIGGGT